jgi:diguanylate cyclase (GGDEF)-like protein
MLDKRWYIFFAFILTVFGILIAYIYLSINRNTEYRYHSIQQLKIYSSAIEEIRITYETTAKTYFELAINQPKIQKLMAKAANGSDVQKDQARHDLYLELVSNFDMFRQNGLRQLHFHLPQSVSFLRFHRPELYGDSLEGIRTTVGTVNLTHKEASGFEEGRTHNGFRHVFPIFYNKKFVGSVEVSYSFDAIRKILEKTHPAYYQIILSSNVVKDTVFNDEQINYIDSTISKNYYLDNDLDKKFNAKYSKRLICAIENEIAPEAAKLLPNNLPFTLTAEISGERYLVLFNPIESFSHKKVGYVITYLHDPYLKSIDEHFWEFFIVPLVIIPIVIILLIYVTYQLRLNSLQLKQMANYDALTNISNRNSLSNKIQYAMASAKRYGEPLSVIFFDIDFFKKINDTFSHEYGDKALIELAQLIQKSLRESDAFGRWGGEEFLIVLPNTELGNAVTVADKLRKLVEKYPFPHGFITCSFGVAQWVGDETQEEWINRADQMLYLAKKNGRNQVQPTVIIDE